MVERRVSIVIDDKMDMSIFQKLENIGKKAADAETRLQGLQSRLNGIGGSAIEKMLSSQERLAVSTNKTTNNTEQLAAATQRTANQQEQMAKATDNAANAQSRYNQMVNNTHNVQLKTTKSTGQMNRDLANLTYQLNDIGVSLAGGQNPFLVMIQQGSQIGQIYGGNGLTGIFKGLAGGILSLIKNNIIAVGVIGTLSAAIYGLNGEINSTIKNKDDYVSFWNTTLAVMQVLGGYVADEFNPIISSIKSTFSDVYDWLKVATIETVEFLMLGLKSLSDGFITTINMIKAAATLDFGGVSDAFWKGAGEQTKNRKEYQQGTFTTNFMKDVVVQAKKNRDADKEDKKPKGGGITFAEILKQYEEEANALRLNEREAERYNAQVRAEKQLKRELTAVERELLDTRIKTIQTLKDDKYFKDYAKEHEREVNILKTEQTIRPYLIKQYEIERALKRDLSDDEKTLVIQRETEIEDLKNKADMLDRVNSALVKTISLNSTIEQLEKTKQITATQARYERGNTPIAQGLNSARQFAGGSFGMQAANDNITQQELELLNMVEQARSLDIEHEKEYQDLKTAIIEEAAARRKQIETDYYMTLYQQGEQGYGRLAEVIGDFAGKQSQVYRTAFAVSKAFSIANSIIEIQGALAKALNSPFPQNLVAMGTVAAQGANIISNIQAIAAPQGFKTGGFTGNGGTSDIAGVVHGQEFVINAEATRKNMPELNYLNKTGSLPSKGTIINVNNFTSARVETQTHSDGSITLTMKDVKDMIYQHSPKAVAKDMENPNSKVSRSITKNTNARRNRA